MRPLHVLALLLVSIIFAGCSSQGEVIRVGEPTVEDADNEQEVVIKGHEITNEITDESNIEEVKKVVDQIDSIERPDRTLSEPPETFLNYMNLTIQYLSSSIICGCNQMVGLS